MGMVLRSAINSADTTVPAGRVPLACTPTRECHRKTDAPRQKHTNTVSAAPQQCVCTRVHLGKLQQRIGRAHAEQAAADLAAGALRHQLAANFALGRTWAPAQERRSHGSHLLMPTALSLAQRNTVSSACGDAVGALARQGQDALARAQQAIAGKVQGRGANRAQRSVARWYSGRSGSSLRGVSSRACTRRRPGSCACERTHVEALLQAGSQQSTPAKPGCARRADRRKARTAQPASLRSAGRTTSVKVTMLLTGLPGSPNTSRRLVPLPPDATSSVAKVSGFPGFMRTCPRQQAPRRQRKGVAMPKRTLRTESGTMPYACRRGPLCPYITLPKCTVPRRSSTGLMKSLSPMDTPPGQRGGAAVSTERSAQGCARSARHPEPPTCRKQHVHARGDGLVKLGLHLRACVGVDSAAWAASLPECTIMPAERALAGTSRRMRERGRRARTRPASSPAMPKSTTRAPAARAAAASMARFASRIWPGASFCALGSTSSSPVDRTPTHGCLPTCSSARKRGHTHTYTHCASLPMQHQPMGHWALWAEPDTHTRAHT